MKQQSVEGEYAYILWAAETADNGEAKGRGKPRVRLEWVNEG
jgi:hypothetical protein